MYVNFTLYLLTPWCRVLLEKLTGLQLVKKFPAFLWNPKVHYRTHKRPPPVPILGQPIQSTYPHPTSWRSILILSTHLRLGLPSGSCFIISFLYASTCFEHYVLIIRRSKLYYTVSGIIIPVGGRSVHRMMST